MNILVSACLLGVCCKYNGTQNLTEEVLKLREHYTLIPVCPEQLGGLTTPREPVELVGIEQKAMMRSGKEVTAAFIKGAQETLRVAQLLDCKVALLKENSPSCGFGTIYDGSFSGKKIAGNGMTADYLDKNGIPVFGESQIEALKEYLNRQD